MNNNQSFKCRECRREFSTGTQNEETGTLCRECATSKSDSSDRSNEKDGIKDRLDDNTKEESIDSANGEETQPAETHPSERFWETATTESLDLLASASTKISTPELEETSTDPLDLRINSWKDQLLDLTRKNKLVNFSDTKTKSLSLYQPDTLAIAEALLAEEPIYVHKSAPSDQGGDPPAHSEVEHNEIASTNSMEETAKSLRDLWLNQKRAHQEKGVNALSISFCTLRWFEIEHSDEPLRSPLFLLSANLERKTNNSANRHDYELTVSDFDFQINPALRKKLSSERGLILPPDEVFSLDQLAASVKAIEEAIEGFDRWEIIGEVLLAIFDFTKFSLYADLEKNREAVHKNALIKAINGDPAGLTTPPETPTAGRLDEAVSPIKVYQVLEADSSQQEAIEAAKRKMDFVLQGPPGTGKSQTIANIIAEKLAVGEKVLFVSEKQAALDVVKNRLDEVGLGRFCLEAHGSKADKGAILDSLAAELRSDPIRYPNERDSTTAELEAVRRQLNEYGELLFYSPDQQKITVYEAMGRVAKHVNAPSINLDVQSPLSLEEETIEGMSKALSTLANYEPEIEEYDTHRWRHTTLKQWRVGTQEMVQQSLATTETAVNEIIHLADQIGEELGVSVETIGDFERVATLVQLLADLPDAFFEEQFFDPSFYTQQERLELFIELEEQIQKQRSDLAKQYTQSFFSEDGSELHAELSTYGFLKSLQPSYRSLRSRLLDYTKPEYNPGYDELTADAQALLQLQQCETARAEYDEIRSQLGLLYNGSTTDWNLVWEMYDWVNGYQSVKGLEIDHLKSALITGTFSQVDLDFARQVSTTLEVYKTAQHQLGQILDLDQFQIEGQLVTNASLWTLEQEMRTLQGSRVDLQRWVEFSQRLDKACSEYELLEVYLSQFLSGGYEAADVVPAFEKVFFTAWLNQVYDLTDLGSFSATEIEQQLAEFRRLDRQQQEYAKVAIQHEITKKYPRIELKYAESSEQVFLRREINKSRQRKPLRTLFREAPGLISTLKPCFMMSPLSVAQYLEYDTIHFDVVIFDEASQIMPQDAVSSLIRADQTIIAGDTKQLPPTAFFNADTESTDDALEDLESILDEAASVLPEKQLLWHYRSNTNELIEFSNQKYYDSRLKTFPGNAGDEEEMGVSFDFVEDGLYDRGGSAMNEPEAKRVVDLIEDHIETRSSDSLGVVAFSQKQAQAIRDEIERRRETAPVLGAFVDDHDALDGFFVKSIENVQGDERDRLLFSVGYGPDREGRTSMNFGPLNQSGGERRLNVVITRARDQITVVSSIRHSDIDLGRTNSRGVRDFKHYLEYAEEGPRALRRAETAPMTDQFDSGFEEAVYTALRQRGYQVDTQVQSAGYSVDLGIKDPQKPGRYVLGIECDGAAYHSSQTARDRDRTRQAVLENLGWEIHRIWSPDWTANQEAQLDKISDRIALLFERTAEPAEVTDGGVETQDTTDSVIDHIEPEPMTRSELTEYAGQIVDYQEPASIPTQVGEFNNASQTRIQQILLEIIHRRGPIESEVAYRHVIAGWNVTRLGKNIRRRMDRVSSRLVQQGLIQNRDGYLWSADTTEVLVRKNTTTESRKIEEIPPEELSKAAYIILDEGGAMSRSDLVLETTRLFGYSRTGPKIEDHVDDAISQLISQGAVTETKTQATAQAVDIDQLLLSR